MCVFTLIVHNFDSVDNVWFFISEYLLRSCYVLELASDSVTTIYV